MKRAQNKAERLIQIENLLLAHPEGLTQAEIARRLHVDRSTINRYVADIPKHIYIEFDGRWKIDRTADLINVRLNLHEALAVHLASRLLATRMDRQNPHAASALRKLGVAMQRWAARISRHILESADVMDEAAQRHDPVYLRSLEQLTLAWAEQRKAQVWHYSEKAGRVYEYLLSPYFIEPYAVGQTTHVIGMSEPPGKLRTLKIERIERVEPTQEPYEIPVDFDPRDLLANAWGIWYGENDPVEITLKFHPRVAGRVRETRWHRSEQETELPDGSILWKAKVAEPQEMLPWIRGWGADVEVMEPKSLRETLERETRRLAQLYEVVASENFDKLFFAHTKEGKDETEWQLLKDHLKATGDLAYELGSDAGISELARVGGLLHDLGKYSLAFQARLRGSKKRVDHATAGAKEIMTLFPTQPHNAFAELLSFCIAGHHTGLPDYGSKADMENDGTLLARREKKKLEDYSAYKSEFDESLLQFQPPRIKVDRENPGFSISFLTRMAFSTLVDADWLETERHMQDIVKPRSQYATIESLAQQFNLFLQRFGNPQNEINRKRTETLKACIEKAEQRPGFFTLTVPTGGGKTYASMAFALNHAVKHGLKRVIYVIPFTSIIEQNAAVFREALEPLGQENILEHHSNFDWDGKQKATDNETNKVYEKLKLAAENWDIPIIVTTNVQFFESLFASKKKSARKLHNIAKSVIIFDEVQVLPRQYLKPCLLAVQELVQTYGVSAVFCTATQPSLQRFFSEETQFTELAPTPQKLFDFYRRVQVKNLGSQTDVDIVKRLNSHQQVLCIVNTRKHAKGTFDQLDEVGGFHLSTLMCPEHRKKVLAEIKSRLNAGETCRVVSTQVMEAGIDVDFPVGYRAMAGLDSIIQAAGRVNREGKQPSGDMFVFDPKTEFIKRTPIFIKQTASVAENTLREFGEDPTTIEAIEAYYNLLYKLQDEKNFDTKNILGYLDKGGNRLDFEFATAAENFKLIDENTVSIIIPFDKDAIRLINILKYIEYPASTVRKLQTYTVNIYEREFLSLQSKGVIQTIGEQYNVLDENWMGTYYHPQTGLLLPESGGGDAVFFE